MPFSLLADGKISQLSMTELREYTEGKTTFLTADVERYTTEKKQPTTSMPVFYNPRMRINRDFSVLFLATYMKDHEMDLLCEPLAGSGIRTLRYLNEVPGDFQACLFDVNPTAIDTAIKNIERYDFQSRAQVIKGDAKVLILTESRGKRFDFVDVDPFGTPVPYLNAAIQSLNPYGGLLGLTATDMPALCGVYPHVALRKYGGLSMRAPFVHELAVRLLLGRVYNIASMNDRAIEPLAVLSTDHYIRVWIRIESNRTESNKQTRSMGFVSYCKGCMHSETHPLSSKDTKHVFQHQIDSCEGKVTTAGPLWIGDLYEKSFLETAHAILENDSESYHKKIPELLDLMIGESDLIDYPYVDIHELCDLYNYVPPKREKIMEILKKDGYSASRTHFKATSIRTNAPVNKIEGIIRKLSGV